MSIKLVGDWAPCFRSVESLSFDSKLLVNLEGPVLMCGIEKYQRAVKAGPSLHHTTLPKSEQSGILILANNHFMDFGESGLAESIETIEREKWLYVGAGCSKVQAQRPVIFDWNGKKVGLLARCEIQFGIASEKKPGVAGFDSTIFEQIRRLKTETDIVIASIHAAAEMLPWPSPRRQETWRALIDAGADIVHGHHAHVPQGWEEYNDGFIFYGLGNFCVDPIKWSWHLNGLWSLAPKIDLVDGRLSMRPTTAVIEDLGDSISVRDANPGESTRHTKYLIECNKPLADRKFLEGLWQEASIRMYKNYYADWLGFDVASSKKLHRFLRSSLGNMKRIIFNRNMLGSGMSHSQSKHLLRYHLFACDSHNDAIGTALGVIGGELEDLRTDETARLVDEMVFKYDNINC